MVHRRSSMQQARDDRSDSRGRYRRRRSSANWAGPLVLLAVIAALLVTAFIMADKFAAKAAEPTDPPGDGTGPRRQAPPEDGPRAASRPAPEIQASKMIPAVDSRFREAKRMYDRAVRAEEEDDLAGRDVLLADCRTEFEELAKSLRPYTDWLAEANEKNWEVPSVYRILEKRIEEHDRFRRLLPGNEPKAEDKETGKGAESKADEAKPTEQPTGKKKTRKKKSG